MVYSEGTDLAIGIEVFLGFLVYVIYYNSYINFKLLIRYRELFNDLSENPDLDNADAIWFEITEYLEK